jgi:hypothetical protein
MGERSYKGLLVESPILLFVFDVGKPWFDAARSPKEILFIDSVLIGLCASTVSASMIAMLNSCLALTIR